MILSSKRLLLLVWINQIRSNQSYECNVTLWKTYCQTSEETLEIYCTIEFFSEKNDVENVISCAWKHGKSGSLRAYVISHAMHVHARVGNFIVKHESCLDVADISICDHELPKKSSLRRWGVLKMLYSGWKSAATHRCRQCTHFDIWWQMHFT